MQKGDMPRRVERKLIELIELFQTDQPDGLIADEIVMSSALADWALPGSEFAKVMAVAEKSFTEPSFWTSPPQPLVQVITKMRAQVARSKSDQDALDRLVDTFNSLNTVQTGPN